MSEVEQHGKSSNKRRLLVRFGIAVVSLGLFCLLIQRCDRIAHEQEQQHNRLNLLHGAQNGRQDVLVHDADLLSMLANDSDCVKNITSVGFSMLDLSDPRFRLTGRFTKLNTVGFYDCHNADNVLESIRGMPTVESVCFEVSHITESGIRSLATLPNLKRVEFEQILSADEIELLRRYLPHTERSYWGKDGLKEVHIQEKP